MLTVGDVRLDVASAAVTKDGREVFLSALEYRLLLYFLQHKGKLVTRENLRDAIWDSAGEYVSDNALNVYVKRLREKVETDPAEPELIVTVRGLGYKWGSRGDGASSVAEGRAVDGVRRVADGVRRHGTRGRVAWARHRRSCAVARLWRRSWLCSRGRRRAR